MYVTSPIYSAIPTDCDGGGRGEARTFAMLGAKSMRILWRLQLQFVVIQPSDDVSNDTNSVAASGGSARKHVKLYYSIDILGIE